MLKNTRLRREDKRKAAELRNAEYAKLTLKDKLARQKPNGKVFNKLMKAAKDAN